MKVIGQRSRSPGGNYDFSQYSAYIETRSEADLTYLCSQVKGYISRSKVTFQGHRSHIKVTGHMLRSKITKVSSFIEILYM